MKNIALIAIVWFALSTSYGQDTLYSTILPEAQFTYIVHNDQTNQYVITPASSVAQTWDFSFLQNNYEKVPTYDSTVRTPHQSLFPQSNLYTYGPSVLYSGLFGGAPVDAMSSKGYMFWKGDATGFWIEGFMTEEGNLAYQPIYYEQKELVIPLRGVLDTTFSNYSKYTIPLNFDPSNIDTFYVSTTQKQFKYDAFGAIQTPYYNVPNVLRLHEYTVKVDSVYGKIGNNTVYSMEFKRDTTNTYYYFSKDYSYPILTSYADKNNHIKFTEFFHSKVVNTTMGVNELVSEKTEVYPNPFSEKVTIHTHHEQVAHVYSSSGVLVASYILESGINEINLSELNFGIYFLSLQNEGWSEMIKIIKN